MTASILAQLAAAALRLADAHRAELDAQRRYDAASLTVGQRSVYRDSEQFAEAQAVQELAMRDYRVAGDARQLALADLLSLADTWNAGATRSVDDKRGESLDSPRSPVEPTPLRR